METDALHTNFGRIHALHTAALMRHLIACRRVCEGDLDLFMVLVIVGERTFVARRAPEGMSPDNFRDATVKILTPEAINLSSIADYCGIPRETVRRKIDRLVKKGWVERSDGRFESTVSMPPLTASSPSEYHRY